ncbi:MAG: hypothetical protein QOJ32_3330, partial [Frankiaceae bacterium]|nr:hypothetical protein [Frankiaceae bacterium]
SRTNAKAPASSAVETKGVAAIVGALLVGAVVGGDTGGGGAAPF